MNRPDSDLYTRVIGCLAAIRDLEAQGCHVTAAHCHTDRTAVEIDPPPPALAAGWDWVFCAPLRGVPRVPVTCRHDHDGILVEWHPAPRSRGAAPLRAVRGPLDAGQARGSV